MHKACVFFSYYGAVTFFLQMEEVRQDVAAPETQHTCNAARCYAMQASQTCLWPNKQQRKITITTTITSLTPNDIWNCNRTGFSSWRCIVSNYFALFILQNIDRWHLICVYVWNWICAKYRHLICLCVAVFQRLLITFASFLSQLLFALPPSLTCKPSGMGRYNVAECTLECIDLCYRALSLDR